MAKRYISSSLNTIGKIDTRILFITYVGLTIKEKEVIYEEIDKKMSFERIYFREASPVVAVNCGPGTFGLLFMTER